jgi:hypothetical protein
LNTRRIGFILSIVATLGLGAMASAQTPFANFNLVDVNSKPFTLVNPAGLTTLDSQIQFITSTNGLAATAVPVTFFYTVPNGYGAAGTPINATMLITSIASGTSFTQGAQRRQNLQNVEITFRDAATSNLLLRVLNTSTGFIRTTSTVTASFGGDTATAFPQIADFSSDFLDFTGSTERAYQYNLTSAAPSIAKDATDDYLASFTASGNGSFTSNATIPTLVPEPGTLLLGLLGLGLLGKSVRRRL